METYPKQRRVVAIENLNMLNVSNKVKKNILTVTGN